MSLFGRLQYVTFLLRCIYEVNFIFEAIRKGFPPNVNSLAGDIFDVLVPKNFKEPLGTVSRSEFISAVDNVFKLFMKQ